MVLLRATDTTGAVRHESTLAHGEDPTGRLAAHGLAARFDGAHREDGELVLRFVTTEPTHRRVQRVAAYAVVIAAWQGRPSVLLTEFVNTRADGWWGLPGGGLDPDEEPVAAVLREVWEETGQRVAAVTPMTVVSEHWQGPSPSGEVEDFHAVRLVHTARCPDPTAPVVHDVGGTTASARWVALDGLGEVRLLEWAVPLVQQVAQRP